LATVLETQPAAAQTSIPAVENGPSGPVASPAKQPGSAEYGDARIGPNAVLQSLEAAGELESEGYRRQLRSALALPESWPKGMIPETWFLRTVEHLRATLPPERAEAVLRRAGTYTADYVGQHRVPKPFRGLLRILPRAWAIPLLLEAFRRHAWTFAGSGSFRVEPTAPRTLVLEQAPTCRTVHPEGRRGGAYYEAAFEGLLTLAGGGIRVVETDCVRAGASACRFTIHLSRD
jgi:divinyl protochlorophyllide a 8-vinyl-reductase